MARIDVLMPQMGESITEGTVSKWLKKVGDAVQRDEPLFEISTDKVDAEIPSPNAGILAEIKVQEGQTVPVQTLVGVIETDAAAGAVPVAAPKAPPVAAAPTPVAPAATSTALDRPRPPDTVIVSALTGTGLDTLLATLAAHLPESPFHYDPEEMATQPMRFFAAEFIREAAFETLREELPYSVAVEIDEFREGSSPVYIRAIVYVERESQKGIVIGEGGRTIKTLGTGARAKIEPLLGERVFLELHVKVLPKWRRQEASLKRLGYAG